MRKSMKKSMKLTYLLTLLLLLFSFTACGDKEDTKSDKDNTKVEDNKDKDEDKDEDKDDEASSEDASSEDEASSEENDSDDDANAASGSATIGDITFSVNESWELDDSSVEGVSLTYMVPSSTGDFANNFIIQITDAGTKVDSTYLEASADSLISAYESMDATIVDRTSVSTDVGTALVFTLDVTKMLEAQGVSGMTGYIKQAVYANGTSLYIAQLTCAGDDFATLESEFDAVVESATLK